MIRSILSLCVCAFVSDETFFHILLHRHCRKRMINRKHLFYGKRHLLRKNRLTVNVKDTKTDHDIPCHCNCVALARVSFLSAWMNFTVVLNLPSTIDFHIAFERLLALFLLSQGCPTMDLGKHFVSSTFVLLQDCGHKVLDFEGAGRILSNRPNSCIATRLPAIILRFSCIIEMKCSAVISPFVTNECIGKHWTALAVHLAGFCSMKNKYATLISLFGSRSPHIPQACRCEVIIIF